MLSDLLASSDGVVSYAGGEISASSTPPSSGSVLSNNSSDQTDRTSNASTDDTSHGTGIDFQGGGKKAPDLCNLIVNYLPYNVSESVLAKIFSEYGEIAASKIIKDKVSKNSLGYGFVKFVDATCASDAIAHLNGYKLNGKVLKVSVARPPSEEIKNCKLYITNLPKAMSTAEVQSVFKKYGEIIECRLLQDTNGGTAVSRGVAFVQYNLRQEAEEALAAMNGRRVANSDKLLLVKYADDQQAKGSNRVQGDYKGRQGGEGYYFQPQQHPRGAPALWFPRQEGPLPYAYEDPSRYMGYYSPAKGTKLLVSSLPVYFNNHMLNDLFAQFGNVLTSKVIVQDGLCSGEGYVKMASDAEAHFAAQSLQGAMLSYDSLPLAVRVVWRDYRGGALAMG